METLLKFAEIEVKYVSKIKKADRIKIGGSKDAEKIFRQFIGTDTIELVESFCMLFTNRANEVMGVHMVSTGATAGCMVDPKIIFSIALKAMAHGIIVCHNHPSGNLIASTTDIDITKNLVACGKLLEIAILDHIILSPCGKYLSFADDGRI